MKLFLIVLFLSLACAVPQFDQYKNFPKGFTGDDGPGNTNDDYEQIPYKVIQKFDVSLF